MPGTTTFFIALPEGGFRPVEGYKLWVAGHPEVNWFVFRRGALWYTCVAETGRTLFPAAPTKSEATEWLYTSTAQEIADIVELMELCTQEVIAAGGRLAPGYEYKQQGYNRQKIGTADADAAARRTRAEADALTDMIRQGRTDFQSKEFIRELDAATNRRMAAF